jgi:hypothetical protein
MFVLVSIAFISLGLYVLAEGQNLMAGLGLACAGLFAMFLGRKISTLEERLAQESKEYKKLVEMVARQANQRPVTKSPSKRELKATPDAPKAQKTPKASKPKVPQPSAPEPPVYLEPESPEFLQPEAPDDFDYGPEEPTVDEADPAVPVPTQVIATPYQPPVIITRTSSTAGGYTQETWKGERTWSPLEVDELLELYFDGDLLESIAIKLRIDKKDVVYKLTRLNFDESDDLEDASEAHNDRRAWSEEDSRKLIEMNVAGITLTGMARILGRTKLAIGWRLVEQRKLLGISKTAD